MRFYTNVAYDLKTNLFNIRGYDNGKRVTEKVQCKPYMFVSAKNGETTPYKTLHGKPVVKKVFETRRKMADFVEKMQGTTNFEMHGFGTRPFEVTHAFINDYYPGTIQYDQSLLSILFLDIETDSEGGFPDLDLADKAVTAITVRKDDKYVVLGMYSFVNDDQNTTYIKCKSESDLLDKFLTIWKSNQFSPDIITGWNVEQFDIPYLYNRINRVLGDQRGDELSPFGIVEPRKFTTTYGEIKVFHPAGVAILDYLNLYKKFSFTPQESYKLDHIAHMELGEKKLDFRGLGFETLDEFYKKDFQNFIKYNIKDVELVWKLEEKLKLIEQVCALAYDGKVNLVEAQTTVRMWDVIIHNHLRNQNIVVPHYDPYSNEGINDNPILGAYVKDPIVGLHNWVVSFDLNSLYPHLIMQYNISPDTYVGRTPNITVDKLIDGELTSKTIREYIYTNNVTFCGTGCMFDRDRKGFLPELMEKMYNDRVVWKKRMIEAKKQYEAIENEIARRQKLED